MLLTYRDMEALYRQVSVLPGWITSQGLRMVYEEVEFYGRAKERPGGKPRVGISFEQHQKCVSIIAKRLRLTAGPSINVMPDYLLSHKDGISHSITVKKKRLTVDPQVVRAFARIFRAVSDDRTYRRFCSRKVAMTILSPVEFDDDPTVSDKQDFDANAAQFDQNNQPHHIGAERSDDACHVIMSSSPRSCATREVQVTEEQMSLSDFVGLLRYFGLMASSSAETDKDRSLLKIVSFNRAKEIFEKIAGLPTDQLASLSYPAYLDTMRLIAAELDSGAAPYIFSLSADSKSYPQYAGNSLLGNILSLYRDDNSLVCELALHELLVLVQLMHYCKIQVIELV